MEKKWPKVAMQKVKSTGAIREGNGGGSSNVKACREGGDKWGLFNKKGGASSNGKDVVEGRLCKK